ncbi:hypothetical protein CMV_014483 [Castanea mollissima]|uniref:Uncharacterized protein n=1 Tax=Castanea mollissima TaxID=60419 RepID=A0A8J4VKY8_9ROSI|nr:hypothetical protein CMV_014483 [Castanea mollissima]
MANNQEEDITEELRQPIDQNLQMQALLGEMRRTLRAEIEPIHERLDRVEVGTPRGQQHDIHNRQQGGCVPWRNVEEEAESKEVDEPYVNRGRFERGYAIREARMVLVSSFFFCAIVGEIRKPFFLINLSSKLLHLYVAWGQ